MTPGKPDYNWKSHYAKTIRIDSDGMETWGDVPKEEDEKTLAHPDSQMTCFSCHSSWMTSCFGCHLSMTANRKMPNRHNEGDDTRNFTTYNYQVLRDDVFMLGRDGTVTGHKVAPVASRSAVVVSSQNQNREWIYSQQQTVSAEGFSGQAFSTHVPHTVRSKETMGCTDCHVSEKRDNNAWMAQLMLQGTNFVNFMGRYVYVAAEEALEVIPVTEHDEPQAVFGCTLHKVAYPDNFAKFEKGGRKLKTFFEHIGNPKSCRFRCAASTPMSRRARAACASTMSRKSTTRASPSASRPRPSRPSVRSYMLTRSMRPPSPRRPRSALTRHARV